MRVSVLVVGSSDISLTIIIFQIQFEFRAKTTSTIQEMLGFPPESHKNTPLLGRPLQANPRPVGPPHLLVVDTSRHGGTTSGTGSEGNKNNPQSKRIYHAFYIFQNKPLPSGTNV